MQLNKVEHDGNLLFNSLISGEKPIVFFLILFKLKIRFVDLTFFFYTLKGIIEKAKNNREEREHNNVVKQ